jgi:hypothetical protein
VRHHLSRSLLAVALVVMAFAAVLHAAAEIDPCLLDGRAHTGQHETHACPACSANWIVGPSTPTVDIVRTPVRCERPTIAVRAASSFVRLAHPRGPPRFFNF